MYTPRKYASFKPLHCTHLRILEVEAMVVNINIQPMVEYVSVMNTYTNEPSVLLFSGICKNLKCFVFNILDRAI